MLSACIIEYFIKNECCFVKYNIYFVLYLALFNWFWCYVAWRIDELFSLYVHHGAILLILRMVENMWEVQ